MSHQEPLFAPCPAGTDDLPARLQDYGAHMHRHQRTAGEQLLLDVADELDRRAARIRELEADGRLERLTTEGTRRPFITGRAMTHYDDDVVVSRACLQRLCDLVADVEDERVALRKMEQENIRLRRKLNAVIDWTEATSEDEDGPDWPLTTYEPYAAARNRVRSIIEEEQ